ncbi:MAG: nucleotidyltransferase domain-containing protein [Candidatus Bathyarchaeia archaeon]|nr:nucleotidyltransferase domain-containing protein [Candidatus Bathyarchaeota archaeon]
MLPRERLRREADKLLNSFLKDIQHLNPRCVIVFGSYVRGDFTESSDIDVCVIAQNLPEDELSRRTLAGLNRTPKIRAIGFYPEEFLRYLENQRFLAYDIVSEGKPVFDDGFYATLKTTYDKCVKEYGLTRDEAGWRVAVNGGPKVE